MQSALDIFCYVLVLIYGLALSADISTGGHVSRQQKYLLTLLGTEPKLAFEDDVLEMYRNRLAEFKRSGTEFIGH